ncbi:transcription-repair coupling factor [Kaistia dalseonensis]|uniref:Transcription-repair-coupling factor n=1 Tax=Kaistia dalseonensis TaxID=410840 RepID=A0ABU0H3Q4_9HYPH|nr:transcription-repair coupling factor [Kaistia dalseonensis]MCX5494083.1 transcription-repair coupling factor [Kaistia dalseonensis]MDQ0436662.1 transcription-repair coupling factor (superfamily II helicase) [Kaistia dalseonensis]
MIRFDTILGRRSTVLSGVPDGMDGKVVADLAALCRKTDRPYLLVVARDGTRMADLEQAIRFFAPATEFVSVPAWDCMPYDRVSPNAAVIARRMAALSDLAHYEVKKGRTLVVLTTVNAIVQRVPRREQIARQSLSIAPGNQLSMDRLTHWLEDNGFLRTSTVREAGEYAVRGGIVDLFAAGQGEPIRVDFFGDTIDSIRSFDVESQRTIAQKKRLDLVPMSEVVLSPDAIARFREHYVALFGATNRDDLLYHSVSEGRRYTGLEHWLPLFVEGLDTLFDYVPGAPVVLDHLAEEAIVERLDDIVDHYDARKSAMAQGDGGVPYRPIPPKQLYLDREEWTSREKTAPLLRMTPFAEPDDTMVLDLGGRQGRTFAAERTAGDVNVFDAVINHIGAMREKKRVVIASWSEGARDRLAQVLADHNLKRVQQVGDWYGVEKLEKGVVGLAVFGLETGFETPEIAVVGEQDILGDRLVRPRKRSKKASDFLTEVTGLAEGDLVVHVDHGIGRFAGLKTITAAGAPHDCLEITYQGGDRLYLPVENIELLSRYGSEDAEAVLDKLGGVAWQARKAKLKKRIRDMAGQLIKIAAARAMRHGSVLAPPEGLYDEFAARFPYEETEDQFAAIEAVIADLSAGTPMDRLICGDVGFGKTEVALRAAFVAVMSGKQVAVVVPTTLLSRQHFKTFSNRFAGFAVRVEQASRLVTAKDLAETKKGLKEGQVDIVVGTHALLGKGIEFKDLGLLIIDEEQHFGVKHKERLKELKADVHVLTLSATPIPRTLQLALTGVRELSLITTPPVDRMAVRTFISPFDALTVREALLRERYRGGQSFYVCPRLSDLAERKEFLEKFVPEVKVAVAHGQMPATELEDVMNAFYDGAYDVLLSTTIVESGLDIPTANTLIVHRADMFGLAQLYQLRGRVGRSKTRAYALFTVPAEKRLTAMADRRLKVLQSLDTLGAGFQLASHDLDIRGAGNLLGEEQSGHIKEVGYELYQQMLEEAVAQLRQGGDEEGGEADGRWSPQITVGTPVMLPETYVPDLQLRLGLYRRLGDLDEPEQIDSFGAELIDRFGPLPEEVEHLLKIVYIKALCRKANVEKVDAGPKGIVIAFRHSTFPNPAGLIRYIGEQGSLAKVRPDQKIVLIRDWEDADKRLKGTAVVLTQLARLATGDGKKAA